MGLNVLNIADKMLAKNEPTKQELYLKTILDSVLAGIIMVDPTTRKIVEANPVAIKMMGAAKEEIIGSPCHQYVCQTKLNQCPIFDLGQQIDKSERILQKANGEKLKIIKTVTKVMFQEREYLLESFIDITEEKKLEVQLRQAQKIAAVGTLAGGIAHDFNNILQVISGKIQLMLMKKDPDDLDYGALEIIEKSIQRGHNLTRQLLACGRQVKTKFKMVDLDQELSGVYKLLDQTLLKTIHMSFDHADDLKSIKADPSQLEQIILNLTINARDAMPGGGELAFQMKNEILDEEFCKVHPGAKMGEYVLLSVADSGSGMDQKTLEHIFEPFYTTKTIGKGTGLGLAMVYRLVKNHGGYILCDSMPGHGTTFNIYFPVAAPGIRKFEPMEKKEKDTKGRADGTENILFVDDEKEICIIGKEILKPSGYQILTAATGEAALEIFTRQEGWIDLVILDLNMPGMGGYECLNRMVEIDPEIKIIISSGDTIKKNRKDAIDSENIGFIQKPYRLDDLLSYVRKMLDSKRS